MNKDIVLIGPVCVGKSTQAGLIAQEIDRPQVSIDRIANQYYNEFGFSNELFINEKKKVGALAARRKRQPALLYAVEKILEAHNDCVFDFGAGHSCFHDKKYQIKLSKILDSYTNILLLLPSPDLSESLNILRERSIRIRKTDWIEEGFDHLKFWIEHKENFNLAKHVVYTENKTDFHITWEILDLCNK